MTLETRESQPETDARLVAWVRQAAPYIHAFRGRTFVIAFGTAAGELAHSRAAGHIAVGVGGQRDIGGGGAA